MICSACASECAVCQPREVVCQEHGELCPDCGHVSCAKHGVVCRRCGARLCSNCNGSTACRLCSALQPAGAAHVSHLLDAIAAAGLFPKGSLAQIKMSAGTRRILLSAETGTLFVKHVLVSLWRDGRVIRCVTYNFGQKLFGGRTDLK